jgi:hypothetical protein
MHGDVTQSGRKLHSQFRALGDLTLKSLDEIVAGVGPPTSRSSMPNGEWLLQWQETGYHIALVFNAEGRAVRITHEYAHFASPPPSGCLSVVVFFITVALMITYAVIALV